MFVTVLLRWYCAVIVVLLCCYVLLAFRTWHRAQLRFAPALFGRQFGGKAGASAFTACTSWFASLGDAGSESNMRKAFETVDSGVARLAMEWMGVDRFAVSTVVQGLAGACCCTIYRAATMLLL